MIDAALMRMSERLAAVERELERRQVEVHGAPVLQLDYTITADVWNAQALGAGSITNVHNSQSFTTTAQTSIIGVNLNFGALVDMAMGHIVLCRTVIDGVASAWMTPQIKNAAASVGAYVSPDAVFDFRDAIEAGSHLYTTQIYVSAAATIYLRCASVGVYEHLRAQIVEFPQ